MVDKLLCRAPMRARARRRLNIFLKHLGLPRLRIPSLSVPMQCKPVVSVLKHAMEVALGRCSNLSIQNHLRCQSRVLIAPVKRWSDFIDAPGFFANMPPDFLGKYSPEQLGSMARMASLRASPLPWRLPRWPSSTMYCEVFGTLWYKWCFYSRVPDRTKFLGLHAGMQRLEVCSPPQAPEQWHDLELQMAAVVKSGNVIVADRSSGGSVGRAAPCITG